MVTNNLFTVSTVLVTQVIGVLGTHLTKKDKHRIVTDDNLVSYKYLAIQNTKHQSRENLPVNINKF